jgi:hypothetical protein
MQPLSFSALPPALVDAARSAALASGAAVRPENDGSSFPVRCCLSEEHSADEVLLLSVQMPAADSPYTAPSPVYIHSGPCSGRSPSAIVPEILPGRRLSLRAYDERHMITGTAVVEGDEVEPAAAALLDEERAAYVFAHFAGPGCYACRIDRA